MIGKIVTLGFILLLLGYSIWWLWQRQPKSKIQESPSTQITNDTQKGNQELRNISPQNFSILDEDHVKIGGYLTANSLAAIFSNVAASVTKTDEKGKFESEINLTEGLNLINIVEYSKEPKEISKKTLVYFRVNKDKKSTFGQTVYAGSVKNIFDSNFVISVLSDVDKNVKTTKSTTFDVPSDEEEATLSAIDIIRVGDFAIITGDISQDTLTAKNFQVIRENKPQIVRKIALVKIASNVKNNTLSVNSLTDSKIEEFTLSKTILVQEDSKSTDPKQIQKNKTAIVIFSEEKGKKNLIYIYILP